MQWMTIKLISDSLGLELKFGEGKYFTFLKIWFSISIYLSPGGSLKYIFSLSSPCSIIFAPIYENMHDVIEKASVIAWVST